MTRRTFLKHSIGGGALLSLAAPAVAQSTASLRLLSTDADAAVLLTDKIAAATGGDLAIETDIVAPLDAATMLGRVADGGADMCLAALDSFLSQNLAFGLFANMPFGMCTGELEGWVHASDGSDMLAMLGEDYGVSLRFAGDSGPKPMWSTTPLANLADLQGRIVGSSGLGLMNLRQIGVQNVVDLSGGSVDPASVDVIDGMSVTEMQRNGLDGRFSHVTMTNPNHPSAVMSLVTANSAMEGLSEGQRVVIERAASAALADARASAFDENARAFAEAGSTITTQPIPDDIRQALSDGAQSILKTIFDEGATQATIVDAYVYFLTDIAGWSEIGEAAFYTGRKRLVSL